MSGRFRDVTRCLICGNTDLRPVLSLGTQALTGHFPQIAAEPVTTGPLGLLKCHGDGAAPHCGLLQLGQIYDAGEMYGMQYGYRSGLNQSMVRHLRGIAQAVQKRVDLRPGDLVLDIGSNDGTLLSSYDRLDCRLVGVDPTGAKFAEFYPSHVELIPEFFSAATVTRRLGPNKARVITSIAMFYDLEHPQEFVDGVRDSLADDGVWLFEQSYMPRMLDQLAYDTVCHEHLEYYGLRQVKWLLDRSDMDIVAVEFNDANGGSFRVTAAKRGSPHAPATARVASILAEEETRGCAGLAPYEDFAKRVARHRTELRAFFDAEHDAGRQVLGYGASTKGNVVLQYCGIGPDRMACIAEVNADKIGRVTPGTHIPIVWEAEARLRKPDSFLVLPWHFRDGIVRRERRYLEDGGKLVMVLPRIEVIDRVAAAGIVEASG